MSFLLPQIIKNFKLGITNNVKFDYWYIFGFLATNNVVILYENIYPNNYFRIKPYPIKSILLVTLFILQVTIY